jgi:hypothetical protein
MLANRESSVVWVLVCVSVACGGRSIRHGDDRNITIVAGGAGGTAPLGVAGMMIAVGGPSETTDANGGAGTGGQGGAGQGGTAGTAGKPAEPPEPPEPPERELCNPDYDPLDPTTGTPCPTEPPPDDCDELAHEYEVAVGIAQWCNTDADCHAGIPVAQTLHCGCDVIVTTVAELAPIAAEWRAHGCADDSPCAPGAACVPTAPSYICGEAGFCLDDRKNR